MSAPPPPPPPPPPPGWKPNWKEQRAQEEQRSEPMKIPKSNAPSSPRPTVGSNPDGSFNQYDLLPDKLQSTLAKDKKPFTYTPAGLDLSEIRSPKFQRKVNKAKSDTYGSPSTYSPIAGPGSPPLNEYGQQAPLWPDDIQDITEYCNNPSELDPTMTNPRYTGSKIPSKSFKVLQALTQTSDDDYASSPEPMQSGSRNQGSLHSSQQPIYSQPSRVTAPPIPPKPKRGIPRDAPPFGGPSSYTGAPNSGPVPTYTPTGTSLPGGGTPFKSVQPPSMYSAPAPPPIPPHQAPSAPQSMYAPPIPAPPPPPPPPQMYAPPVPPPPAASQMPSYNPMGNHQKQSSLDSFYQPSHQPIFKTYTPPPSLRQQTQSVKSGPGYSETTTHRSGPGYEETTTYKTMSQTLPAQGGSRNIPVHREVRQASSTARSFQSTPMYESPYQTLLNSPHFSDPFKIPSTPSVLSSRPSFPPQPQCFTAPVRNEPFLFPTQSSNFMTTQRGFQNQSGASMKPDRPMSINTSRFFDEINQMFDQTSANISREMYGTEF